MAPLAVNGEWDGGPVRPIHCLQCDVIHWRHVYDPATGDRGHGSYYSTKVLSVARSTR
jgi:hypothetical protein